jgi:hypothetical protein
LLLGWNSEQKEIETMSPATYREQRARILASPAASYWLKDAVRAAERRDIVDALRDAEQLAALIKARLGETQGLPL